MRYGYEHSIMKGDGGQRLSIMIRVSHLVQKNKSTAKRAHKRVGHRIADDRRDVSYVRQALAPEAEAG